MSLARKTGRSRPGNEQISTRVTDEQYEFIMSNGGAAMIRKLIFHEYTRKLRTDPDELEKVRDYDYGDFGASSKRVNVRLYPALQVFVRRLGGSVYIRALVQSYMEFRAKQKQK